MENSSLGGICSGPTTLISGPSHSFIQERFLSLTSKSLTGVVIRQCLLLLKDLWGLMKLFWTNMQWTIWIIANNESVNNHQHTWQLALTLRDEMFSSCEQEERRWRSGHYKASGRANHTNETILSVFSVIAHAVSLCLKKTSADVNASLHVIWSKIQFKKQTFRGNRCLVSRAEVYLKSFSIYSLHRGHKMFTLDIIDVSSTMF